MVSKTKLFTICRSFFRLVLILAACILVNWDNLSLHSKDSDVETNISINSAKETISKLDKYKKGSIAVKLMIYDTPVNKDDIIKPAFASEIHKKNMIECNQKSWLFVADYYPKANFKHQIDIGIINYENKDNPDIIEAEWWPTKNNEPLLLSSTKWKFIGYGGDRKQLSSNCDDDDDDECKTINPNKQFEKKAISSLTASGKLYAIVICGYYENEEDSDMTLAYDAYDMYSLLKLYNIPDGKIFYITPYEMIDEGNAKIKPEKPKIDSKDVSLCNIKFFFDRVSDEIKPDEKFLFYISTHGGINELYLSNNGKERETFCSSLLDDWLSMIHCKIQFIVLSSCYSGSIIPDINGTTNRIIITSCDAGEIGYKDIDKLGCDLNIGDRGSEFLSGFILAFSDKDADVCIKDEKISIYEAFYFARNYACCADNSITTMCGYEPKYHPQIVYSTGIKPYSEFFFWD
ncbi:MAG: hypothetical protein QG657_50 [Acidobacteriota bacterium]|nr:hypothetical protein [Acidobacteriota bacterium]